MGGLLITFLVQYQTAITALIGGAAGTLFIYKKLLEPIAALLKAQLSENGGGSLVDKVNQLTKDTPANHKLAEEHWTRLEDTQIVIAKDLKEKTTATDLTLVSFDARLKRLEAILSEGRMG